MNDCLECRGAGVLVMQEPHWHPETWEQVSEVLDEQSAVVRDADGDLVVDLDYVHDALGAEDDRYVWYQTRLDERQGESAERNMRYRADLEALPKFRILDSDPLVSEAEVAEAIASIQRVPTPAEERTHLIDDHETQRTAGRRPLRVAQDLLGDALVAIKAGDADPAIDLVERALSRVNEAYVALDRKA